jgi:hypothetical protein
LSDAQNPAPAATPAPAAPSAKPSIRDQIQALKAGLEKPVAAAPATAPAPADSPASEPPAESPRPTSGELTRMAQTLQKLTKAEAQALEHKSTAEKNAARVAELEAKVSEFEAARGDINKLLQYGNVDLETLGNAFLQGKLNYKPTPEAPKVELPDDVKRDLEYARSKREQEERETAQKAADEARAADLKTIEQSFAPLAEQFPMIAALPGVTERLLDWVIAEAEANNGEAPDLADLVKRANEKVTSEVLTIAGNDAALKTLVADEGVAAKLRAMLGTGAATTPTAKAAAPTLTAKNTAPVPSRGKGALSSDELRQKILQLKT